VVSLEMPWFSLFFLSILVQWLGSSLSAP
jgi:hypothetical protein